MSSNLFLLLFQTEKFSEMKEEIPQAVIDSHVKNATNRSEKRKVENATDENSSTGKEIGSVCIFTRSQL